MNRREIHGFPGYAVGDDGSVWTCWKSRWGLGDTWRAMKPVPSRGYLTVAMVRGGKKCRRYVHHLVLEAFVGPRPAGTECCHNDGDGRNNAVTNLRWDTTKANRADAKRHGTFARGEQMPHAKLSAEAIRAARTRNEAGVSGHVLAKELGVSFSALYRALRRETWKHV